MTRWTRQSLIGRKTTGAVHINMGGKGSMWSFGIEGVPRLLCSDHFDKKARKSTRTWFVDAQPCRDLETALAVINGDLGLEQAMQPRRFSLTAQIEEIDRELKLREGVYPRLVATNKLRQSEADYHMDRLRSTRATLAWLLVNEPMIKQRLSY